MPIPRVLRVIVCRGCCCGTERKHPRIDHAGHLAMIRAAVKQYGAGEVRVVDCLSHCERSSIVVLQGLPDRRQPLWFGGMDVSEAVHELCDWIASGARGEPSGLLDLQVFDQRSLGRTEVCG
jgi:predicted metal-binding protein